LEKAGFYAVDKKQGPWIQYDEQGIPKIMANFTNDLVDGITWEYDEEGYIQKGAMHQQLNK
jgi:antitoxin component YwqK of YwqJK toxin-antitoxin module